MSTNSFITFVKNKHFDKVKNIAYGKVDQYLLTLYQGRYHKLFILPLPSITKEQKVQVLNFLKLNKKELVLNQFLFDNTVLIVRVKESFHQIKVERIELILDTITQFLKENHIGIGQYCVFCGKENATEKIKMTRIEYYMHQSCYDKAVAETEHEDVSQPNTKKNHGLFGAILGAILIGIPWIFLSEGGWFSGMLAFLIADFALIFYQIFNGRMEKYTKLHLFISTIIGLIVSEIFILIKNGVNLNQLFTEAHSQLLLNLEVGILMTFIGFIVILFRLKKS